MALLLSSRPVVVIPELAVRLGLAEAILLQQIQYWVTETTSGVEHAGRRWIYNTLESWQKQLPFYSESTIKRALGNLRKLGVLSVEQINKSNHDMTNYYAINYDSELLHEAATDGSKPREDVDGGAGQNDPIDKAKIDRSNRPKRSVLNGSKRPDLTENTTEITTENLSLNARASAPVLPEVQNAILTQRVPQVSSSLPSAFPMSLTWNPGPEFEKYARMLGLTNPAYSEAQLNEFRMYWEPTGRCFHHTQWIQKFVQRLKSDLARGLTNDQRNNNSSSRTSNRPASAGNSAWHRGLDAMRELLAEQGYLDEAAALGGSSDGYDAGYASVRHSLASDASAFEQQGDAGRIYEGDYADFDLWEGDDQAD